MTAIFEFPLPSETMDPDELTRITGCGRKSDQVDWLTAAQAAQLEVLADAMRGLELVETEFGARCAR